MLHNDALPPVIDGGYYVFKFLRDNFISHGAQVLDISIVDLCLQGILVRYRNGNTCRQPHIACTYTLKYFAPLSSI